jgi:hypothetical protein
MFCAKEGVDIPETVLRYHEAWGWVHPTDHPHTVKGDAVPDGKKDPNPGR